MMLQNVRFKYERSLTRENGEIFHVCTEQGAQRSDPDGNPKVQILAFFIY